MHSLVYMPQKNPDSALNSSLRHVSVSVHKRDNNNNNNNDDVYGAVILAKATARVHPVHIR